MTHSRSETSLRSTCRECGMVHDTREYHPFAFCAMFKAGIRDPWRELRIMALQVGLDDPGEHPLFVTDIGSIGRGEVKAP